MPLAVDAGGAPVGVSDLEKPFAGSLAGPFRFTPKAQPSRRLTKGTLAGALGDRGDRHLLKKGLAQIRRIETRWMLGHLLRSGRDAKRGEHPLAPLFPRWYLRVPPNSRKVPGRAKRGGGATNHPNQPVGFFFIGARWF